MPLGEVDGVDVDVDEVAGLPVSELGALRLAPLSTPTPSRSTNSPPNQAVTRASSTPASATMKAKVPGPYCCSFNLSSQLMANSATTTTLPPPCSSPTCFARV